MKGFEIAVILFIAVMVLANTASAQYWFQSGARASQLYSNNEGASVNIQTISPQSVNYGSFGFWVGETLSNGAFIQTGYEIPNQTGYYPNNCTPSSGCTSKILLKKNVPTWFFEYFPAGDNSSVFYGSFGPDGSISTNGSVNNYAFRYSNGLWNIYINGELVGSVNLGTSSSGTNEPTVFAEDADTNNNNTYMEPVTFSNLSVYKNGHEEIVSHGYSYVGYGTGSKQYLLNPYGVEEITPYVNKFMVGSGLPIPKNYTTLWSYGYYLRINSPYGNKGNNEYSPYSSVNINEPEYLYLSNNIREHFEGWIGTGIGSYTGKANGTTISIDSNITEQALWQTQYYVNATTEYGNVTGSGWYANGTEASISILNPNVNITNNIREHFVKFSNGLNQTAMELTVILPINIYAEWQTQYYVNATTEYGNVTGSGWYNPNSTARISLTDTEINVTNNEYDIFVHWSNGVEKPNITLTVNKSYSLSAVFNPAYAETIRPLSQSGNPLNVSYLVYNGKKYYTQKIIAITGQNTFEEFNYDGVNVTPLNNSFYVNGPGTINVTLPVFNVTITATDILGKPISGRLKLLFQNGTIVNTKLNSNGQFTIPNVPYGNVTGTISYSGFSQKINPTYSGSIAITMLTPGIIIGIIALIIIITTFWFYMQSRQGKRR